MKVFEVFFGSPPEDLDEVLPHLPASLRLFGDEVALEGDRCADGFLAPVVVLAELPGHLVGDHLHGLTPLEREGHDPAGLGGIPDATQGLVAADEDGRRLEAETDGVRVKGKGFHADSGVDAWLGVERLTNLPVQAEFVKSKSQD